MSPGTAITLFMFALGGALVVGWPRHGLMARLGRLRAAAHRVMVEDAVKHVYQYQAEGFPSTIDSIAAHLGVSRGEADRISSELGRLGLVRVDGVAITLTRKGEDSALRLVRSYRLWERYLADRTGVPASRWHREAERMEHSMSADEAEELAARLGHPTHDPRGQPIPTADGAMPPLADLSLYALDVGESVEVVRLVDQSPEVLEGLERRGIGLGTRLEVVGRSESTLTVHTGTEPVVLGHLAAAAVAVRRTPKEVEPASPVTLSEIPIGGTARVTRISPACQGPQRRRFMDLGVVPGTEVSPEFESGAGDPVAYRISGALIALRRVQARWIEVEPVQKGDAA